MLFILFFLDKYNFALIKNIFSYFSIEIIHTILKFLLLLYDY